MFSIPNSQGNISQTNDGESVGSFYATFGIDLDEKGKIKGSEATKVYFDGVSEAEFSSKIVDFVRFGSNKFVSLGGGDVYISTIDTYFTYTRTADATPGDSAGDMGAFFDGLILVADSADIQSSTNGSSYSSWWQGTLSQSALNIGSADEPRLMKVGANGNLYISDNGNLIYRVTTAGSVAKTGNGTLDFSATNHVFTCMEPSSTRMWIGTKNIGGEAVIIEWDMSENASTPNRIHNIGADAVRCIMIFEDTPIAILSDGNIKYFNGNTFVKYPGIKIRVPKGYRLASNFVHRNGWDIIDGLPHVALSGLISSSDSEYDRASLQEWAMPSGVYCLDPEIGLYHRYSFGTGDNTRTNYGEVAATDVGALIAVESNTGKFLVSYETMLTDTTTTPTLAYHVRDNSIATRSWFATTFAFSFKDIWKKMSLMFKPLDSGAKIRVYTRAENTAGKLLKGTWSSTTQFNAETTGTGIAKGNMALIKMGDGAGEWVKVADVSESSSVTSITLDEANAFATAGDKGTIEVFDFKFMGEISNTTKNEEEFTVPASDRKRKRQFLVQFIQPASTQVELDAVLVE